MQADGETLIYQAQWDLRRDRRTKEPVIKKKLGTKHLVITLNKTAGGLFPIALCIYIAKGKL